MPANKGRKQLTNFSQSVAANPLALAIEAGLIPTIINLVGANWVKSVSGHAEAENPSSGAVSKGMLRALERQERTGQREASECDMLPTEYLEKYYGAKGAYTSFGIKIGKQAKDDPLFTHVTLPDGWKKRPSDHPLHVQIVDECGNVRITYFYDAKFYSRRASMHPPKTRYNTTPSEKTNYAVGFEYIETHVYDATKAFWFRDGGICEEALIYSYGESPKNGESWVDVKDRVDAQVKAWLESNYPQYDDPLAYWPKRCLDN